MSIISIKDLTKKDIEHILIQTFLNKNKYKSGSLDLDLKRSKIGVVFFEDSTRTYGSFYTAASDLGATVLGRDSKSMSTNKGESLLHTILNFEGWGYDAVVMRHPLSGSARYIDISTPMIIFNGGDGPHEHPTQSLLDLYTIYERFFVPEDYSQRDEVNFDGLKIGLMGDLKYGRTTHSLLEALNLFGNIEIYLVSPPELKLGPHNFENLSITELVIENDNFGSIMEELVHEAKINVLYATRIQKERFADESEFLKVADCYRIVPEHFEGVTRNDLILMHPLPINKEHPEIDQRMDTSRFAYYFEQAGNGLYTRATLFLLALTEGFKPTRLDYSSLSMNKAEIEKEELPLSGKERKQKNLLYNISNGTFIDHLEQGQGLKVREKIIGPSIGPGPNDLDDLDQIMITAENVPSTKHGVKDILGVVGRELSPQELCYLSLMGRHTVNIVRDGQVIKKFRVRALEVIRGIIPCENTKCVSHAQHKEGVESLMIYDMHSDQLKCFYCDRQAERI